MWAPLFGCTVPATDASALPVCLDAPPPEAGDAPAEREWHGTLPTDNAGHAPECPLGGRAYPDVPASVVWRHYEAAVAGCGAGGGGRGEVPDP